MNGHSNPKISYNGVDRVAYATKDTSTTALPNPLRLSLITLPLGQTVIGVRDPRVVEDMTRRLHLIRPLDHPFTIPFQMWSPHTDIVRF